MTQAEFDDLLRSDDRLEKIIIAFSDGRLEELNDRDFKYFETLRTAFKILCKEPIYLRAKQKIGRLLGVHRPRVNMIVRDVKEVFANIEETNIEFDRQMLIHRLERLIKKIEKVDPDSKNLPAYYKLIAEIKGLTNHQSGLNMKDVILPQPIFTTNINEIPSFGEIAEFEVVTDDKEKGK